MGNKFTVKKDLVEVRVAYVEFDDEFFVVRDGAEKERLKDKIHYLKARFNRPNFEVFNKMINGCIKTDENGEPYMDTILFRERKLRSLLRELEDEAGEVMKATPELFNDMIPDLAIVLVEEFDKKVDVSRIDILKKYGIIEEKKEQKESDGNGQQ